MNRLQPRIPTASALGVCQTYTAIAQLLRVVDIIEGNEKLASGEKAETKKETQS